jgi:hypothetical protein
VTIRHVCDPAHIPDHVGVGWARLPRLVHALAAPIGAFPWPGWKTHRLDSAESGRDILECEDRISSDSVPIQVARLRKFRPRRIISGRPPGAEKETPRGTFPPVNEGAELQEPSPHTHGPPPDFIGFFGLPGTPGFFWISYLGPRFSGPFSLEHCYERPLPRLSASVPAWVSTTMPPGLGTWRPWCLGRSRGLSLRNRRGPAPPRKSPAEAGLKL